MEYLDELDTAFLAALGIAGGVATDDLELAMQHEGTVTRLRCKGELVAATAGRFGDAFMMSLGTDPTEVHVDTTQVTRIDLDGVAELLRGVERSQAVGTSLRFVPGPVVGDALELLGSELANVATEGQLGRP